MYNLLQARLTRELSLTMGVNSHGHIVWLTGTSTENYAKCVKLAKGGRTIKKKSLVIALKTAAHIFIFFIHLLHIFFIYSIYILCDINILYI